jgi:pimeloyl-ACP methyl ester carboxylesterase
MEPSESHAAARDGTRIWWQSRGRGSPAVVLTDGIACSGFVWKYLEPALAGQRRVLRWHYRGHGRSEPPRDPRRVSVLDCVDDLLAVLDAAGERRAVLAGHSMGVQVCLETHRAAPGRVAGLLLVCGSPGHPLDTFHDQPWLARAFPVLKDLVETFPAAARLIFEKVVPSEIVYQIGSALEVNRSLVKREDLLPYLEQVSRLDPVFFAHMLSCAAAHDATDHLKGVDVPTLVVAGEKDTWTPLWLSERMHASISDCELLVLPGGTHVGPIEHPELVQLRVEKFLRERVPCRDEAQAARPPKRRAARRAIPPR